MDGTEPKKVDHLNDETAFVLVPPKSQFIPDDYQLFYDTYIDLDKRASEEQKKQAKKKKDKGYEFKPTEACNDKKSSRMQKFKSLFKSTPKRKQRIRKPGSPKPKQNKKRNSSKNKTKYPIQRQPIDQKKREEMKKRYEKEKEKNLKKAEGLYPKKHCCIMKEILKYEEKCQVTEEKKKKRFLENPEYKLPKRHQCDLTSGTRPVIIPQVPLCSCNFCRKRFQKELKLQINTRAPNEKLKSKKSRPLRTKFASNTDINTHEEKSTTTYDNDTTDDLITSEFVESAPEDTQEDTCQESREETPNTDGDVEIISQDEIGMPEEIPVVVESDQSDTETDHK